MDFQEALKRFDAHVERVYQERGTSYNRGITIPEYFIHGYQDFTYELNKKVRRADSELQVVDSGIDAKMIEHFVDIVNYARYGGAIAMMKELELQERRSSSAPHVRTGHCPACHVALGEEHALLCPERNRL